MEKHPKPMIYEYSNYRTYLKDLCAWQKATSRSFSFRNFSRQAGFRAPNFFQLIIDGKRNITAESMEKIAKAFKLNKEEGFFFRNLVFLNQAATLEEKKFYSEQLIRSRLYRKLHPLKQAQLDYYSHWYFIPIRELVGTVNFQENPDWIAHRLSPPITSAEAKKGLEQLESLGLIRRNEEGKLIQTEDFVATGDEVVSSLVSQFHREMIQKGSEALDRFRGVERDISSLTVALTENGFKQIKELIQKFRKELLSLVSQEKESTGVYQVNFQLFPLTKTNDEKESP